MSIDILEPVRVPSCYRDENGKIHQTLEGAREANRVIAVSSLLRGEGAEEESVLREAIAKHIIQHKQKLIELLSA